MRSKISIFILLFASYTLFGQQDMKVLQSTSEFLLVEYTPHYNDTSLVVVDQEDFFRISIAGGFFPNADQWGAPAIPAKLLNVGVPSEYGSTIEIIRSSYKELRGKLIPVPTPVRTEENFTYSYIQKDAGITSGFDADLITFGQYGISRGMQIQSLIISPVQYEENAGLIRLYDRIVFKVNFPSNRPGGLIEQSDLLKNAVLNYPVARQWRALHTGRKSLQKVSAGNSVLAAGKWYRFEAPEEGIYRITRSELSAYGIDPASVDPRTIKIFNNGGKTLPEGIMEPRPADLLENAILIIGEEDGSFDANDYILFYGRGTDFFSYDTTKEYFRREYNPYSFHNYYWITSGGDAGKRMQNLNNLSGSSTYNQSSTDAFDFHEVDQINVGQTGRTFLGEEFSRNTSSRTFEFDLPNLVSGAPITYRYAIVNNSESSITFEILEHSDLLLRKTIQGWGSNKYSYGRLDSNTVTYNGAITDGKSILGLNFTLSNTISFGYLDYLEIFYRRNMAAVNNELLFYSDPQSGLINYTMNGFSGSTILAFNISEPSDVKRLVNLNNAGGGTFNFQRNEIAEERSSYLAVTDAAFKTPVNQQEMTNQNLRGFTEGAQYIIITPAAFLEQADRLKKFRQNESRAPLSSVVVDINQIYNEFSCGMADPVAIRDYLSYAYKNWNTKPEYVLFFGGGNYDYKDIEGEGINFIPPFETTNFLDEINSYCYDDFYSWIDGNDPLVDVAAGRITASSLTEARNYVDKIIAYEQGNDRGTWRNRITLVADDALTSNGRDGAPNTEQSETLSNFHIPASYNQDKIYLATYPTVMTSFGRRKPEVNDAIVDAVNEGTVILNFIGHGSPELWTHEQVFVQSSTIPRLKNTRNFFLTAATCDFGYFDRILPASSTEEMLVMKSYGSIGAFTAVRPVFSILNAILNEKFYDNLLSSARDTLNIPYPVGKAYFNTKLQYYSPNDQKYHLFGDPALRLQLPQYRGAIDSINGTAPGTGTIQIKALSRVDISGSVLHPESGLLWGDYNGEGLLTLFDSKYEIPLPEISSTQTMTLQDGIIFRGRVSVNGGRYNASFIVPKDILYENQQGKALIYFYNEQGDGIGYTDELIVGGTDTTSVNDGNGPEIDIYFDDPAYERGYLVNVESSLIIRLSDETGLNTTGTGIGHNLEGYLDGDESAPIDLTPYFTGDTDSGGKSGSIEYQFAEITPGYHTLSVQAWDVYNNVSREEISFEVVDDAGLQVSYVMNYPNPFSDETYFTFQQNLSRPLDVRILIYTVSGRKINEIERLGVYEKFVKIGWDGRDKDGDHLANGTYLYKVIVKTVDGEFTETVLGKLAVIR